MSTLLLSLLLIALVAIGLLMAVKPVREMFANPNTLSALSYIEQQEVLKQRIQNKTNLTKEELTPAELAIVAAVKSSGVDVPAPGAVLANLTATPFLTPQATHVDTLKRDQDLQKATDAGSSASYSDSGVGDESSIRSWTDLTPTEYAFVKDIIIKAHGDVTAPLTPPMVVLIAEFRKSGRVVLAALAKGDSSINSNDDMTIDEYKLVISGREATGTPANAPPTDAEKAMIVNRRKAFLAKQTAPSVVKAPATAAAAASSGLSLTPDETAAVLKMRKAAAVKQARALVAQEEPVNSNPTRREKAKGDEDYDDDYSGYASVAPSQRRRSREHRNYERDHGDDCPDMSQYIKLDEIPCWNCTLP